jgi:cytoskeletal protein CcmA (bactofilin family)
MFNRRKPEDAKPAAGPEVPDKEAPGAEAQQPDFLSAPGPGFKNAYQPEDNGLDVPPYRPIAPDFGQVPQALPKETPMARTPFTPNLPPSPSTIMRPAAPGMPTPREAPRDGAERRTLVVGRGISVQGTIQDAERLVVEGTVEAAMTNGLAELAITNGGIFKGEVEVDEAEVAGTIDGTLVARNTLIIRSTGRVLGTARCRRLQVEDGGQITGRIEMLGDIAAPVAHEAE